MGAWLPQAVSWGGAFEAHRNYRLCMATTGFCMHLANVGIFDFVSIPYPERSSAKTSCRQVNEGSSLLQPLINRGKIPDGTPSPPHCAGAVPALRKR